MNKIHVIGIGYRPLDKRARQLVLDAEVILSSNRLSEVFRDYEEYETVKDKVMVINNVEVTIEFIRKNYQTRRLCLLASGDPMFFGIGRRIVREFGTEAADILPDLSSVQMAFSRIKEPWNDVFFMSLHGGPDPSKRRRLEYEISDLPSLLVKHRRLAILTDKKNNPSEIAKSLCSSPETVIIHVCERLGYADEKIIAGDPDKIAGMSFADPNVVIIQAAANGLPEQKNRPFPFGLTENEIRHSAGLITKDEIRAVSIHKLKLPQNGVLWDIGAGSGSMSIEAAGLSTGLKVYAIERDDRQLENLKKNREQFDTPNISIIEGEAPDALQGLPAPDRVFIGGSGGRIKEIIGLVRDRMAAGIIVINAAKIETLHEAASELEKAGFSVDVAQISVSRTKAIGDGNYFSALNPVFVIRAKCGGQHARNNT